ncbi:MAG: type II secretion system ATPase GspE [Nitrospirae bacterium]|nr:type II secretion system ATPase GspE [Nitrospirota bacterium]
MTGIVTSFAPKKLGEILVANGWLDAAGLDKGLAAQQAKGGRIGEVLMRIGLITEEQLARALAEQWGLPYVESLPPVLEGRWLQLLPITFAKANRLLPLSEGTITQVAVADPLLGAPLDDLAGLLGPIALAVAPSNVILHGLNTAYDRASGTAEQVIENLDSEAVLPGGLLEEPVDLLDADDEAPIIRLVNSVLFQAVKERASDIHFEPYEREFAVRYRIDGVLYNVLTPPRRLQASVTSRIKIMAHLNIAERRLPQDGRIGLRIAGRDIDVRVSCIPTVHGERLVLRLLEKGAVNLDLATMGFDPAQLEQLRRILALPHGVVLVTGPTGAGKTTTLYGAISSINSPDKNIITIEDPIEYQLKGIGQMQVNPKIELTFASGLRSILRQDPDVILVGEIRDGETAEIAVQAALTGHLVFSTLHTNDSASAVTRLVDMGVEPFLVSSSVSAILAQRLVRRICQHCRAPYAPPAAEVAKLGLKPGAYTFYQGAGCAECTQTGYRGRLGIFEMLILDDPLRSLILTHPDATTIREYAERHGMRNLREDGAAKVMAGLTTTGEVLRVCQEEYE